VHGAAGGHGRRMSLSSLGTRLVTDPREGVHIANVPWLDRRDANLDHCVLQGRLGILREPRIGEIEVRTPKTSGRPVTSLEDFNFKLQSYRELKVP